MAPSRRPIATGLALAGLAQDLHCQSTRRVIVVRQLARLVWLLPIMWCLACDPGRARSKAGAGTGSFALGTCEVPPIAECEGCLEFDLAHRLGETDDHPGFLVPATGMLRVMKDPLGRYWVGQGEELKVFDADDTFVATVGRKGEGPLEFSSVRPIGVDSNRRVHVLDNGNKRVTTLHPDFSLAGETLVPGGFVRDMVVLSPETSTSGRYVLQTWISHIDQIGLALHRLTGGGRIISSFGPRPTVASGPTTPMLMERELALSSTGTVFSADRLEYVVEAWAGDNSRVGALSGPDLDDGLRGEPGAARSLDNPPWNTLRDIHVDHNGRLWVMLVYRRPDWEDFVIERIRPTGQVYLEYPQGGGSVYRTRIEMIDVQACAVSASGWFDHLSPGFFLLSDEGETASVTALTYSPLGEPFVEVWDIRASR